MQHRADALDWIDDELNSDDEAPHRFSLANVDHESLLKRSLSRQASQAFGSPTKLLDGFEVCAVAT